MFFHTDGMCGECGYVDTSDANRSDCTVLLLIEIWSPIMELANEWGKEALSTAFLPMHHEISFHGHERKGHRDWGAQGEDNGLDRTALFGARQILRKPFSMDVLLKAVH